jgi:hypothetical protein
MRVGSRTGRPAQLKPESIQNKFPSRGLLAATKLGEGVQRPVVYPLIGPPYLFDGLSQPAELLIKQVSWLRSLPQHQPQKC